MTAEVATDVPSRESMGPKGSALTRGGKGTDVAGEKAATAKRQPSQGLRAVAASSPVATAAELEHEPHY